MGYPESRSPSASPTLAGSLGAADKKRHTIAVPAQGYGSPKWGATEVRPTRHPAVQGLASFLLGVEMDSCWWRNCTEAPIHHPNTASTALMKRSQTVLGSALSGELACRIVCRVGGTLSAGCAAWSSSRRRSLSWMPLAPRQRTCQHWLLQQQELKGEASAGTPRVCSWSCSCHSVAVACC